MSENTLNKTIPYLNRPHSIGLGAVSSACLGFLLIFSAPYGGGFFRNWLIPLVESYRINFFEGFAIIVCFIGLTVYGIKIKRYEQFLFLSIILVSYTRLLSLLTAEQAELVQIVSVFRYVKALVVIYILANLFTYSKNRVAFIWGLIVGVSIETIMGIYIALNEGKGVFISINTFQLQIFFIIVCSLVYVNKKHRFAMFVFITALLLGIAATQTRSALVQLITVLIFTTMWYVWSKKKKIPKPVISLTLFSSMSIFLLAILFPVIFEGLFVRIISAIGGDGLIYRYYLLDKALGAFLQHPITGIGSGGFARQLDFLPQVFNVEVPQHYVGLGLTTHNTFLGVIAETGVIGLIAYLLWVIGVIAISAKILKLANIKTNGDIYAIAASLMMINFIVSDFWSQSSFFPITNTLLGFMLGWLREKNKINKAS
jgi:O-antigen ligase